MLSSVRVLNRMCDLTEGHTEVFGRSLILTSLQVQSLVIRLTKYGAMKYSKLNTSVNISVLTRNSLFLCVAHSTHTVWYSKQSLFQ
jgi:hypothetical protein